MEVAVKKSLSDGSKPQRRARAGQQHQGAAAHSGRGHRTEQRISEVTARRSPRGLLTRHLQPWGAAGRLWGHGCPLDVPREDSRSRAGAGADTGDRAAAGGTAGTNPTYTELAELL